MVMARRISRVWRPSTATFLIYSPADQHDDHQAMGRLDRCASARRLRWRSPRRHRGLAALDGSLVDLPKLEWADAEFAMGSPD